MVMQIAQRARVAGSGCRRCRESLEHCHGTLVIHGTGEIECAQPGCTGDPLAHAFTVTCEDVALRCCTPELLANREFDGAGFSSEVRRVS